MLTDFKYLNISFITRKTTLIHITLKNAKYIFHLRGILIVLTIYPKRDSHCFLFEKNMESKKAVMGVKSKMSGFTRIKNHPVTSGRRS